MSEDISVLVVDDEPLIAEAHGRYIERVSGFRLAGIVHTGQDTLRVMKTAPADLILLDLNLPDVHGLELCRTLRGARSRWTSSQSPRPGICPRSAPPSRSASFSTC